MPVSNITAMTFEDFYKSPDDPANKRGPHHLKLSRGLNMDRKNPGIVAKMNQIDSSEHPLVRRLKSQVHGKEFIHSPADAQKIAAKYGIDMAAVQHGESKILGNKTGISMTFDKASGKYVLVK